MTKFIFTIFLLAGSIALAQGLREPLYRKPFNPAQENTQPKSPTRQGSHSRDHEKKGNLPKEYFMGGSAAGGKIQILRPEKTPRNEFLGFKLGERIVARLRGKVIAFSHMAIPVVAEIVSGERGGGVLIGEAKLDMSSRRVMIEFDQFRRPFASEVFEVSAVSHSLDGGIGLEGKLFSESAKNFSFEMLTSFISAYSESLVEAEFGPFGQRLERPSVGNAGRKAIAASMSRAAQQFAERSRRGAEFVQLDENARVVVTFVDQKQN